MGTDWLEEYMLRMYGPDIYDDWVSHRIPFNDERVVKALDEVAKITKTQGQVLGDTKGILNTAFGDAMTPAFDDPPKCMIMRQGNFISHVLPRRPCRRTSTTGSASTSSRRTTVATRASPSWAAVTWPPCSTATTPTPRRSPSSSTSDKFGAEWAKAGGWLSPHKTFDANNYPNETTKEMAKIVADADIFRFDGSDLMPKAVGSDSFWNEMVKWQNGQSSQATADAIEATWPK